MTTSLHPIQLLSRTDAGVITALYAVFLVDVQGDNVQVVRRIPHKRNHLDTIEAGLNLFAITEASKSEVETFGSFVITTSDGSRYFAYWNSYHHKLFVIVSKLPLLSFCKSFLAILSFEASMNIQPLLYCLCETPLLPAPGLIYEMKLSSGNAAIHFSDIEQVIDSHSNNVVLRVFHPIMMVAAWEALILERKVLVVTSIPSILGPCCEFLKRMTLPLVSVNLFVPHLPTQLIQAIEAPFPYLVGCDIADLRSCPVDLSESVIVDLDARTVIQPKETTAYPNIRPPDSLLHRMREELNHILLCPDDDHHEDHLHTHLNSTSSYSQSSSDRQVHKLVEVFIQANMSLFCARSCAVSAFYRIDHNIPTPHPSCRQLPRSTALESKKKLSFSMGYNRRFNVAYGFMQLFHDRPDRKEIRHFTPCWVEMDELVMSVYEFADDMPMFYIAVKDMDSAVPLAIEPEGHVFEVNTKQHLSYSFAATDTDSRRNWIGFIEELIKGAPVIRPVSNRESYTPPASSASSYRDAAIFDALDDMNDDFCAIPSAQLNELCLGQNHQSEEDEDRLIVEFRHHFMKTQMVSFLRSQVDSSNSSIFKLLDGIMTIEIDGHESIMKKFLCDDDSVRDILEHVRNTGEDEFFEYHNMKTTSTTESAPRTDIDSPPSTSVSSMPTMSSEDLSNTTLSPPAVTTNGKLHKENSQSIVPPGDMKKRPVSMTGSSGIMRFFRFGSNKDGTKSPMSSDEIEDMLIKQREKELADAFVKGLREQISNIMRSRRQCDGELRRAMVDERMLVLSKIFNKDVDHEDRLQPAKTITIPIIDIISTWLKDHHPPADKSKIDGERRGNGFNYIWDAIVKADDQNVIDSDEFGNWYRGQLIQFFSTSIPVEKPSEDDEDSAHHLIPVYQVLIGILHQTSCNMDGAVQCYSTGGLIDFEHLMNCLAHKFKVIVRANSNDDHSFHGHCTTRDIYQFLLESSHMGDIIGFAAYRLVAELMYRDAVSRLSTFTASLDNLLGSPISGTESARQQITDNIIKRGNNLIPHELQLPDFQWVERVGPPSDVLNETVTCVSVDLETSPCDLSVSLLSRLREMVKDYCLSPIYRENITWIGGAGTRCIECKVVPGLLDGLLMSSGFKSFELHLSQLQKLNITLLNENQRFLFFYNLCSILTVHGLIVKCPSGARMIERLGFMKSCKYNVGGMIFSIADMEHGILRNASSKPMLFGPLTAQLKFSDNDSRKALSLTEPKPILSFSLFLGCRSSPALSILRDASKIDEDLKGFASTFLSRQVKIVSTSSTKTVLLPQMTSMYWEDFGKKRRKVLKYVYRLLPPGEVAEEIRAKLKDTDTYGSQSDIDFIPADWTPALIL